MRQAPSGVLHSLSIRHKRLDARVHLGPQIPDQTACMQAGVSCTAVLPAAWLTGGYFRLGYTLKYFPACFTKHK